MIKVAFLCEAAMKMVSLGLAFAPHSYLKDVWNWLDFAVVVSIVIFFILKSDLNWTIFRTLRLLGILRFQDAFPQMKYFVATVLKSLLQIILVLVILFIFVVMFSMVGTAAFAGVSHYRCRTTPSPVGNVWPIAHEITRICGGSYSCPDNLTCGSLYAVSENPEANDSLNLNLEFANYDNMGGAILSIFQTSTLEGWEALLYSMQDGYSAWFASIYYILCTVICGCFTLSLILPILRDHYFNYMMKESTKDIQEAAINRRLVTLSRNAVGIDVEDHPEVEATREEGGGHRGDRRYPRRHL